MSNRFPVSPAAQEICQEVIAHWGAQHCPGRDLSEPTRMLAARVNSWVSGNSVVAGVHDVMSSNLPQDEDMRARIEDLGTRLGRQLSDAGLLIASPRRGASLG